VVTGGERKANLGGVRSGGALFVNART